AVSSEVTADAIVRRLLTAGEPDKVVLFGSRARKESHPGSDYDLLIIQRSKKPRYARAGAYYRSVSDLPVEVDIVVFTPEEVAEWRAVPQAFITTALRDGQTLYEREI
ncbi:MAG: nucleotidyltransferase domain-containing protein, partial [Acidobacteria bacterium]|nr:nucleotidyltransferase domain-containing protein [Acidobacteriota bacterium]